MIDEMIEFVEYTRNLIPEGCDDSHSRFLTTGKKPNVLRAYDILYRYAFYKSNNDDPSKKAKDAYRFVTEWVEGTEKDFDELSEKNFIRKNAFSKKQKCGYYKAWFDRYMDKNEKDKNKEPSVKTFPSNDQTFREFGGDEKNLKNRLMINAIKSKELRRSVAVLFPHDVLVEIKRRCLESYPRESIALLAGVIMLLGYYVAEKQRNNRQGVKLLAEDFQNWVGNKYYVKQYWSGNSFSDRNLGTVQSKGILGTEIFVREGFYITDVNMDISTVKFIDHFDSFVSTQYVPNEGLYLIDRGRNETYNKLCEVLKGIDL